LEELIAAEDRITEQTVSIRVRLETTTQRPPRFAVHVKAR
jgi:hypothetical protein